MTVIFALIGVVLLPMFWLLRLFKRDLDPPQKPYQRFLQGERQHRPQPESSLREPNN